MSTIAAIHDVVDRNGIFDGINASCGTVWLTLTNPRGAVVKVQASYDGGETWHQYFTFDRLAAGVQLRPFHIAKSLRLRIEVCGFARQFTFRLEWKL